MHVLDKSLIIIHVCVSQFQLIFVDKIQQNDDIPMNEMAYAESTSHQQAHPGAVRVFPNGPNQQPPSVSH